MLLVTMVFELTNTFPRTEIYGIISQLKRAVVSIPSNIAEAWGRRSIKEHQQFYAIAYGSVLEVETQLLITQNLKYAQDSKYEKIYPVLIEVSKMLHVMAFGLKTKS